MLGSNQQGAIGGIEYLPGENAWQPVKAYGFMFIHCIFIIPKEAKGKGFGKKLVETCLDDARNSGMKGVAVVTRKGTWMAGSEVFLKLGFTATDFAKPDFELLAFKFDSATPNPTFNTGWNEKPSKFTNGLYIITSGQCPYTQKAVVEIDEAAKKDFGIIYNGKVMAEHPVSQTRFRIIMMKMSGK